jgi:hypothetical protein
MVKNVFSWIGFALLILPSTARTACGQTFPDLRIPNKGNDNFLLATLDTGSATRPIDDAAGAALRPDDCGLAPLPSVPLSPEPTATDRNSERRKGCFATNPSVAQPRRYSLAPVNPCAGLLRIDLSSACMAPPGFQLALSNSRMFAADANAMLMVRPAHERFHLRAALLQSLGFLVLEHAFRAANDPYLRYLMVHKPFWHDYLASANHFEMNRWGDGDDFLVNYIGHPLEGSVSGNIFIQNDPQGRAAKFGRSPAYWQSRMKAMVWASVYSMYFEIGPVLSEAAIGNEGGYTYIPYCGFYPICSKEPGKTYKPPTNNTGWVDFTVTPLVGAGWIILEDFIEADLVDKLADGSPALKYKILRGALSPSRTMANFLAGKPPWYRPAEASEVVAAFGRAVQPVLKTPAWMDDPRWSFGAHMTTITLPMDWEGCGGCKVTAPGFGISLGYRLMRMLYMDSEFNVFPGTGKRGTMEEGLLGVKIGRTARSWGVFTQVRPGFVHYDKTLAPGTSGDFEDATRFAFDFGGSVEYYASRRATIGFNLGTTFIHYLTGRPDPRQPPVSVLSEDFYATQGSFHATAGYVFRF